MAIAPVPIILIERVEAVAQEVLIVDQVASLQFVIPIKSGNPKLKTIVNIRGCKNYSVYSVNATDKEQAFMNPVKVLDLLGRKRHEGTLHAFSPEPLIADDGLLHRIYGDDIPPQLQPR